MCSCERFQHDEISCSDAVATIIYRNKNRKDYCSAYYSNKKFQVTYAFSIEPLPSESTWDIPAHILKVIMIPPIARKQLLKENSRGVKSPVVNVVHQGMTKRLAPILLIRINIDVLFSIIFLLFSRKNSDFFLRSIFIQL